jgi:hypothetical protein
MTVQQWDAKFGPKFKSDFDMRTTFSLRPHDEPRGCENNVWRYFRHAHVLLEQLELKHMEVESKWPVPRDQPLISIHAQSKEVSRIIDERNHLSDSVRIYSAMAAEGFLNLYGVLRLGQEEFNSQFERLGLIPKAKMLLLVCDAISMKKGDPLLVALDEVAKSRNALVHPKSREFECYAELPPRPHSRTPDTARAAVRNMDLFFTEFLAAVPPAIHLIPTL